jgi:hypothetical protein
MKPSQKTASLRDFKSFKDMIKDLYSNNEVKDDSKVSDTERGAGAKGASGLDELPPNCSRLLLQKQQRGQTHTSAGVELEVNGVTPRGQ